MPNVLHKWKRTAAHWETHYCTNCGLVRFTDHTAAGPVFGYGPDKVRVAPKCKTAKSPQYSLKLKCLFVGALALLFSAACDCNYHYSKAQKKCPSLTRTDTLTIRDTVRINSVSTSTAFHYKQSDTVIVKEGRLLIKYFYSHDTVKLQGACRDTVIYIEKRILVTTSEIKFSWRAFLYSNRWWLLLIAAIFLCIVVVFVLLFREIRSLGKLP